MQKIWKKLSLILIYCIYLPLCGESWAPFQTVSDPTFSADATGVPSFGVDADGNSFIVWTSQETSQSVINVSRFNANTQTWSSPEQIGSDSAGDAHIAVTPEGKAIAVWTNSSATPTIYANIFDGSEWSGEQIVDSNPTYQTQFYPKVAVDGFGRAYIVWQVQGGNLARVIRSSIYFFDTESWMTPSNISTDYGSENAFVALPIISVNSSGTAVATWVYQDVTNSQYKIQNNRFAGGSWLSSGNEEMLTSSSADTIRFTSPTVAVAPNGNSIALWVQYDGTITPEQPYSIMSSVRNLTTSSWSTPIQVSSTGSADISKIFVDVACDSFGDAVAVWLLADETVTDTSYVQATTFPHLNWSATSQTISDTNLLAYIGRVAVDSLGDAYATWTASNNSTFTTIKAAKYTKSSDSWNAPQTIANSGNNSVGPNQISGIVTNYQGDFFAAWFHVDLSTSKVVLQSTYTSAQPLDPTDFIGIIVENQIFGTTEYILQATWNSSPSSNVIFYRIYKNNQLVTEVSVGHPLIFIKLACSASAFDGYQVAAVNSNNVESNRVSLEIVY